MQNDKTNECDWDAWLRLNDHEIEYETIPEQGLKRWALNGELYIATSALAELRRRGSSAAVSTARIILANAHSDCYLQALALDVLFALDRTTAWEYMQQVAHHCPPYILNKMAVLLTCDAQNSPLSIQAFAHVIAQRLDELEHDASIDADTKDAFILRYGCAS